MPLGGIGTIAEDNSSVLIRGIVFQLVNVEVEQRRPRRSATHGTREVGHLRPDSKGLWSRLRDEHPRLSHAPVEKTAS